MGYRSYRRYRRYESYDRGRERARRHIAEAAALRAKYGPAFDQVKQLFFSLDPARLDTLLGAYGRKYTAKAEDYARETYHRWRKGEVQIAGQTMGRLLDILPRVMTPDEKFALIRHLRDKTIAGLQQETVQMTVYDEGGAMLAIDRAIQLVRAACRIEVPASFTEVQGWIENRDAKVLNGLAKDLEHEVHLSRVADLIVHIGLLYRMQRVIPYRANVRMRFTMPTAQVAISLVHRGRRRMPDENRGEGRDLLVKLQDAAVEYEHKSGKMSFVEYVLRSLTPEEQRMARELAVKEGVKLEVLLHEVRARTELAKEGIEETMRTADRMKKGGHQGHIKSKHQTAMGETEIEIKTGRCFIATAAYGSVSHPDVATLRSFRDQWLERRGWGRRAVDEYYRRSPVVARFLGRHYTLSRVVRIALRPTVCVLRWRGF